jgi:hypothetical protein
MPEKRTLDRARKDARAGKSAGTQAGEFVREEIEHVREGKHGARSTKQAIAIGLSKARRAGVKLRAPEPGTSSRSVRRKAERDLEAGKKRTHHRSRRRSRAVGRALKHEGRSAGSKKALSRQAKASARKRGRKARSAAARKAAHTRARAR